MKRLLCFVALALECSLARAQTPALPIEAIKTYCVAAGDSMPAIFGDGRHGPPTAWRCAHGIPYVCTEGADGVACSARSRSRVPLPSMIESCRDYAELPVASGADSFVWQWECRDGKPIITGPAVILNIRTGSRMPTKFDAQGYADRDWSLLR
jgi:hypothetical protein